MTITRQDLVIIKSADMSDNDTGGGLPSKEIVINNKSNEIFDDVSDLQATMGGVQLRKVFAGVMTDNDDKLMASRMAITELPTNPNVSVFMFSATTWADTRKQAEVKLTSYLALGSKLAGHLLESQLQSQQMIQLSLDPKDDVPSVGDSVALVQNEGQSDEYQQFVHVMKVDTTTRNFQKNATETVSRVVATLQISEPLRHTFNGLSVPEFYLNVATTRRAVAHSTQVANANKIYSAGKLTAPITTNTTKQIQIDSIFTQVVPASTVETALPLLNPIGQSRALVKGTDGTIAINKQVSVNPATPFLIGSSVYPSSVSLTVGGVKLTDTKGELKDGNNTPYASIDYRTGQVTWYTNADFGFVSVTGGYTPAGQLTRTMQSEVLYVDKTGAGKSYLKTLSATPLAGSMVVSIQALGKVYTAQDDGKGNLTDTNNQTYGVIDYANKLVNLVLPAIPDSESAVIFGYQTDLGTTNLAGIVITPSTLFVCTNNEALGGNKLTMGSKNATMDRGLITGDFTGNYSGIYLNIDGVVNSDLSLSYDKEVDDTVNVNKTLDVTGSNGNFSFNIGAVNQNSVLMFVNVTNGQWVDSNGNVKINGLPNWTVSLVDDGNGNLRLQAQESVANFNKDFHISGTINYSTGACMVLITDTGNYSEVTAKVTSTDLSVITTIYQTSYTTTNTPTTANATGIFVQVLAKYGSSNTVSVSLVLSPASLRLPLALPNATPILAGSINIGGIMDNGGSMLYNGSTVGTINYATGLITLTDWSMITAPVTLASGVSEYAIPPVKSAIFRTPIAPLKLGSMDIYLKSNGKQISLHPKNDGTVVDSTFSVVGGTISSGITGTVDWLNGVVALYGNDIDPTSISYTAMSYTYIPLSSDVIGLDTAKLPIDGRVPFVRAGDFAVITENQAFVMDNPTPNKAYDIGIERLTNVDISDSNSKMIAPNHVVIDLDTGKFNLTADFVIGDYALPLTADYRLADYGVVTAVDISGQITLNMTISHNYSNNAVFSTALINNGNGVVQARAYNVFSQKVWDAVFRDELNGSKATIQFNNSAYPIIVTNRSSVTERWALIFTSATNFRVVGETLGEVGAGNTSSDVKIINPITGQPYFVLPAIGWSQGGENNAVLRFNTEAAAPAIWLGSAIQPHQTTSKGVYDFAIEHQANVDRERGK